MTPAVREVMRVLGPLGFMVVAKRAVRAYLPPGHLVESGAEAAEAASINAGTSHATWPTEHTRWHVSVERPAVVDPRVSGEVPSVCVGLLYGKWGESQRDLEEQLCAALVASDEWRERAHRFAP